jgi:predicted TIM-barrel fold metal-dependent hydrolase
MLGTDYPYEDMNECLAFLESLGLSARERELLYNANATVLNVD